MGKRLEGFDLLKSELVAAGAHPVESMGDNSISWKGRFDEVWVAYPDKAYSEDGFLLIGSGLSPKQAVATTMGRRYRRETCRIERASASAADYVEDFTTYLSCGHNVIGDPSRFCPDCGARIVGYSASYVDEYWGEEGSK